MDQSAIISIVKSRSSLFIGDYLLETTCDSYLVQEPLRRVVGLRRDTRGRPRQGVPLRRASQVRMVLRRLAAGRGVRRRHLRLRGQGGGSERLVLVREVSLKLLRRERRERAVGQRVEAGLEEGLVRERRRATVERVAHRGRLRGRRTGLRRAAVGRQLDWKVSLQDIRLH